MYVKYTLIKLYLIFNILLIFFSWKYLVWNPETESIQNYITKTNIQFEREKKIKFNNNKSFVLQFEINLI